jgi:hypothetical protein
LNCLSARRIARQSSRVSNFGPRAPPGANGTTPAARIARRIVSRDRWKWAAAWVIVISGGDFVADIPKISAPA